MSGCQGHCMLLVRRWGGSLGRSDITRSGWRWVSWDCGGRNCTAQQEVPLFFERLPGDEHFRPCGERPLIPARLAVCRTLDPADQEVGQGSCLHQRPDGCRGRHVAQPNLLEHSCHRPSDLGDEPGPRLAWDIDPICNKSLVAVVVLKRCSTALTTNLKRSGSPFSIDLREIHGLSDGVGKRRKYAKRLKPSGHGCPERSIAAHCTAGKERRHEDGQHQAPVAEEVENRACLHGAAACLDSGCPPAFANAPPSQAAGHLDGGH
jgi:hypothetical protein